MVCTTEYPGVGHHSVFLPQCLGTSLAFILTLTECPRGVEMTDALHTNPNPNPNPKPNPKNKKGKKLRKKKGEPSGFELQNSLKPA